MNQSRISTTIAIISYITIIGFVIALIMNNDKTGEEKQFNAFHLRQALGLGVASILLAIGIAILISMFSALSFLSPILNVLVIAFAVMGILNANKGAKIPLPIIGEYIEERFGNLFE